MTDDRLREVKALLHQGQRIDAIKRYRELTGSGLKEAKDAVEQLERGESPPPLARSSSLAGEPHLRTLEQLLREGQKIQAIKRHRELTGSGLKEAKDAVDALEAKLRRSDDLPFPGDSRPPPRSSLVRLVLAAFLVALGLFIGWRLGRG